MEFDVYNKDGSEIDFNKLYDEDWAKHLLRGNLLMDDRAYDEIAAEMDEVYKRLGLDRNAMMENYCGIDDKECKGCLRSKWNEPCPHRYMQNGEGHAKIMVSKRRIIEFAEKQVHKMISGKDWSYQKGYKEAMNDIISKIEELR